jgi:hypothetical protein
VNVANHRYHGLRLQLFLAARGGCTDGLADTLAREVTALAARAPHATALAMRQMPDDPFPANNGPLLRPYDAMVELETPGDSLDAVAPLVGAMLATVEALEPLAHLDLSTVVVGRALRIVGNGAPYEARYVYHMRRKAGTTHAQYLDVYGPHARFGHAIPGVVQYVQVHADAAASRDAARELGIGAWNVDSVTELYVGSFAEFFAPTQSREQLAQDAFADELRFVDRENSVQFCLRPITPIG